MKRFILLSFLAVSLVSRPVFSLGVLYSRPARSIEDHKPLWLKSYDATVNIIEQMAVTHVDHVFIIPATESGV